VSTAPWDERAIAAMRESLFHTAEATSGALVLDVESGQVTFDEGWSPYIQGSLTCRVPDAATLNTLDPRTGTDVDISAGYVYPGGIRDVHTLAQGGLRVRQVARPGNTMTLDIHGDELRLQDTAPLGDSRSFTGGNLNLYVIANLIVWMLPSAVVSVTATSTMALTEPLAVGTGANVWSIITDLADGANARVFVDEFGVWQIQDRPTIAGVSAHVLEVGVVGTIESSDSTLSTDEWANAVVLTYSNDVSVWAKVTTGPFAVGTVPTKVLKITRDTLPAVYSQAAARAILQRAVSRGRGYSLRAISAYWLRPGMTVTVQLATGSQERHLVSRVSFDLSDGTMTVRTRVPDDVTITTGE